MNTSTTFPSFDLEVGSVFVSSFIQEYFYSTAGTYTVNVPAGSASVIFEMIGAGGNNPTPPSPIGGGQGGYISGTFTIPPATTSLKVVVGATGSTTTPSGASYINKVGATLFAMVGAGGAFDSAVAFGLNPGGNGGGRTFTSGIANGTDANNFLNPNGAFGGTTVGGLAGLDCSGVTPGSAGQNNPGTFEQALGGAYTQMLGKDFMEPIQKSLSGVKDLREAVGSVVDIASKKIDVVFCQMYSQQVSSLFKGSNNKYAMTKPYFTDKGMCLLVRK